MHISFYHSLRNFLVIYKSLIEFMLNRLSEQLHLGLSNPFDQLEFLRPVGENCKEQRVLVVSSQSLFYNTNLVSYYNRFMAKSKNRLYMVGPMAKLDYSCHQSISDTLSSLHS